MAKYSTTTTKIASSKGFKTIKGSSKTDWLTGSYFHHDTIYAAGGNDHVFGYNGNDKLFGQDGNDYVSGGAGNDIVDGGKGDDILKGGTGNDVLIGGAGGDSHDGGSGTDTVSYAGASSGVQVNLKEGVGYWGDAYGDTYTSIENVIGTDHYDSITGDDGANVIHAGGGSDNIMDGGGNDTAYGGEGNDQFWAGAGADKYFGGTGIDSIFFADTDAGVTVNLATGTGSGGDAEGDTYDSIERVYGGIHDDTLIGDDGDNLLNGGAGSDVIVDGAGDDWLSGDMGGCGPAGSGAAYADTFVFAGGKTTEHDIITDFAPGIDTIDFTQAEDFFGFNDLTNGGDRYMEQVGSDTVIHYYDHTIELMNVNMNDLSADDFLFF